MLVAAFGSYAQSASLIDGLPVYVLSPLCYFAYALAPLGSCFQAFRPYDDVEMDLLDTDGVAFEEVSSVKRHELERYFCPKLDSAVVDAAQRALRDFKRMARLRIGGDDDDDDDDDALGERSCCEKLSSSIDDLMANILE